MHNTVVYVHKPASVVHLVRNSSTIGVVMSLSPDWSEHFLIFHITYDSSSVIIEVWLSGSESTIIRRSALVQQLSVRKDPRSWLRCLIKDEIIIIIIINNFREMTMRQKTI